VSRQTPDASTTGGLLPPPGRVHRAGETGLLAEYPDTAAVLAAAEAVRALSPAHLVDLVPAERTLLLRGADARDLPDLEALLAQLPPAAAESAAPAEVSVGVVYDGEDLDEVAELLGMNTDSLISAHSGATWTAAFGGFAPGFAYLLAEEPQGSAEAPNTADDPVGPPWEVPRRAEPRTAVPAGAVGLASRYCGIYPRPSPGGWQLIGRSDSPLFDVHREPPALLTPGTRVRFAPQRASSRPSATTAAALARAAREAAAVPARLGRRRGRSGIESARSVLEILSPGPLALVEDAGRPGRAAIGVSSSGAFDRGAMHRANRAVGNPSGAAVLEVLVGPVLLRAVAPTVLAISGARAPVRIGRRDEEVADVALPAEASREQTLALDPGDRIEVGPAEDGLRLVLALRGGIAQLARASSASDASGAPALGAAQESGHDQHRQVDVEVLGSRSRDTLSGLGPEPLQTGDVLRVGPEQGLDAVPVAVPEAGAPGSAPAGADGGSGSPSEDSSAPASRALSADAATRVPVLVGPREALLGAEAIRALLGTEWTVRQDSDRVGVRLEGPALPVPEGAGSVPSEPMLPGAVQVPPSGLPVVFVPDHPTTGGYPVIAVVTRRGLDHLAQARPGTRLRFVDAGTDDGEADATGGEAGASGGARGPEAGEAGATGEAGTDGTRWSTPAGR
jgi:KipI family sensor histidine kinase inhibitor